MIRADERKVKQVLLIPLSKAWTPHGVEHRNEWARSHPRGHLYLAVMMP